MVDNVLVQALPGIALPATDQPVGGAAPASAIASPTAQALTQVLQRTGQAFQLGGWVA